VRRAVRGCEAHEKLQNRVEEEDREPNEVLLVTCGLVDERGYTCGIDRFIYKTLEMRHKLRSFRWSGDR
jgi:hypothetical protein